MVTAEYGVMGMTCQHCVAAVSQEVSAIEGVREVSVALNADGVSTVRVTSDDAVSREALGAAVEEAGYTLAG